MKQIRFTKEGLEKLKEEYATLQSKRQPAVEDLKRARELGDLSENGFYKASRAKLSSIDNRMMHIKYTLKQAVVIDDAKSSGINIGNTVTLLDGKSEIVYQIVGDTEANPLEGKISLLSPLGRALENKKVNDEIIFTTPQGQTTYKIIKVT